MNDKWIPIAEADKNKSIMAYCGGKFCGNLRWDDDRFAKKPKPHWCDYGASRLWGAVWMRQNQPEFFMYHPGPKA